jgi:ankyrin repeat protein
MNNTPLMLACRLGRVEIALAIAAHTDDACDFNFKNRAGLSALHYAYQSQCFVVADFLISRGALIDITDQVRPFRMN